VHNKEQRREKYEASWTRREGEQSVIIKFREGEIINN
jgi:hypothetical protein